MKFMLAVLLSLVPASLSAQIAKLKLSSNAAKTSTIVTVDTSGSEGDRVDLTIVPPISERIEDTGGKLLYIVPNRPGKYTIIVTAYEGTAWDQATVFLLVSGTGTGGPDPPPDNMEDRYGLTKASLKHMPERTTAGNRDAMRKWYNDFADKIVAKSMNNDQVFDDTVAASQKKPWDDGWRSHYNSLRPTMEAAKLGLPSQWATAYRDIAKGIPE